MKKLAMILCVLFFPVISSAAPSISNVSGNFNHGNYITITGEGFGTKYPAKPLVWADFEDGSVSENASLSSNALVNNGYKISTKDLPHGRSTKNIYGMANTDGSKTNSTVSTTLSGSSYYFFVKRKFPSGTWSTVSNLKVVWAYSGSKSEPYISTIMDYGNYTKPHDPNYSNQGMATVHSYGSGVGISTKLEDGYWTTWEFQEKKSDVDIKNGILKWSVDGVLRRNSSDLLSRTTQYPNDYFSIYFQNFWTESSPGATYPNRGLDYIDDLYIDSTWSRVMIGNASTFDACTKREPLIPTVWSTSSIKAYFNQGAFSNGENVYVFVVDSNGNSSPGKKITIGGDAAYVSPPTDTSPAPNPPAKLTIN